MTLINDIATLGTAPLFESGATPEADLLRLAGSGIVFALSGDDTIIGPNISASALFGQEGNDTLISQAPGDSLFGGSGNDSLTNDTGLAFLFGESDSDTLIGEDNSTLSGGFGDDYILTEDNSNLIFGDQPEGLGGDDDLGGNDTIILGTDTNSGGDDSIVAGPGNDYIRAGADEPSFLFGNTGNDTITQFPGTVDTVTPGGDTVLAVINTAQPDSMRGGQGNDYLLGTAGAGLFMAGDIGRDTLVNLGSTTSHFQMFGDLDFAATLEPANSADYLYVAGGNQHLVFGNVGNDTAVIANALNNSTLRGGQQNDVIRATGTAAGETNLNNFVSGDRGSDYIFGAFGNSTLWGDNDAVNDGNDTIILQGLGTDVSGNVLNGDPASIQGSDIDTTTSGDDTILSPTGGSDDVLIAMGNGNNTLIGGAGDDYILSMPFGSNGNLLDAGLGNDTYIFSAEDTIVLDTLGNNIYIGKPGAKNVRVTVSPTDTFSGEGQFFVTGNENNFIEAETAGIITGDGFDRLIIANAVGTTDANGGNDILDLGNVSHGTCPAVVLGGDGNDSIDIENGVGMMGSVFGEAGNDTIGVFGTAGVSGVVDGGAGNDSINTPLLMTGASVLGGVGDNTIDLDTILGGGVLVDGGAGNQRMVPQVLGTNNSDMAITLRGGDGDDTLAFPVQRNNNGDFTSTPEGTATPPLLLEGGDGNDFLQGRPFRGDTLSGGPGNDTLLGGAIEPDEVPGFVEDHGSIQAAIGIENFGDGDRLSGGPGRDVFLFLEDDGHGDLQDDMGTVGPGITARSAIIVGTNGQVISMTGTNPGDIGTINGAFTIDTITDFNLNEDAIALGSRTWANATFPFGPETFFPFINIVDGIGVPLAQLEEFPNPGDFARTFAKFNFFAGFPGVVTYDRSTGGLYVADGGEIALIAIFEGGLNVTDTTDPNDFMQLIPESQLGFMVL